MKKLLFAIFILALTGCEKARKPFNVGLMVTPAHFSPNANPHKMLILAGQSNMVGAGQTVAFPEHSRVHLTRGLRIGPGFYAATLLADANPAWDITLVQCSVGATSIAQWAPGSTLYNACISQVQNVSGAEIIGLMWYQGEDDARDNFNPQWNAQFSSLVDAFRGDFGNSLLPLVWAQLGKDEGASDWYANWKEFQENQAKLSITSAIMVMTKDQPVVAKVHHEMAANEAIGERFFRAYSTLIGG